MMEIADIKKYLPHRYPFLLIDRILEVVPNERMVAIKNVSANEEFFNGHFPSKPVMPGVLIIECMAQAAGLTVLMNEKHQGKIPYFTGIDNARFRRAVVPGDQLLLEVNITRVKGNVCHAKAVARVEDQVAAEAELMFIAGE
jgi:3-hydroxyacyl-[acyl-carrier-protein] dehydratase